MTRYELLLFLHVAAAIVWLGAGVVIQLLAIRAERSGDPAAMHRIASEGEWLAMRLFVPASLTVLVFGIALVVDGPWSFSQLWIALGLVGYALSFLVGTLFLGPESGRIAKLIETHGPAHDSVTARIRRIFLVSRVELGILFVVVLDMVLKPTGGDVGFWVVAGGMLAAAAGFALWSYRSAKRPAVSSSAARS